MHFPSKDRKLKDLSFLSPFSQNTLETVYCSVTSGQVLLYLRNTRVSPIVSTVAHKGHSSIREFFFPFASSFFHSRVLFSIREFFFLFASSFFYSRVLFSIREFFFLFASSFFYSRVLFSIREFFYLLASSFFYSRVLFSTCEFFLSTREFFDLVASSLFYWPVLFSTCESFLSTRQFVFLLATSFFNWRVLFSTRDFFFLLANFLFLLASSFLFTRTFYFPTHKFFLSDREFFFCSRILFFLLSAIDSGLIGISTTCVWRLRKMAANYSGWFFNKLAFQSQTRTARLRRWACFVTVKLYMFSVFDSIWEMWIVCCDLVMPANNFISSCRWN